MGIDKGIVKEAMARKGIRSQTELAEVMGITKNQLSRLLSSRYIPYKSTIMNLARALEIQIEDLLDPNPMTEGGAQLELLPYIFMPQEIRSIELFAGAGGLALGMEDAGIRNVALVEIDRYCCETLRRNRPDWNVIECDIRGVEFSKYKGKVSLVTGGFPCQAFSYAGKKLGLEETRGTLFYEFARCVKEVEPLLFIAENVRGLVSHDKGRTLKTIVSVLSNLGYEVQYKLMNALHYGVPQKRERVVIVGSKPGISFHFPEKEKQQLTLRDALYQVPQSEGQQYSESKKAVLKLVPPGGCWRDLPIDIQKAYMGKSYHSGGGRTGMARRISWDEPSLTLTCSPSQKQTERCHPDEVRPFTVREYARIQTFPDDWVFAGGLGERYKQIGNAVPVKMSKKIGEAVVEAFTEYWRKL